MALGAGVQVPHLSVETGVASVIGALLAVVFEHLVRVLALDLVLQLLHLALDLLELFVNVLEHVLDGRHFLFLLVLVFLLLRVVVLGACFGGWHCGRLRGRWAGGSCCCGGGSGRKSGFGRVLVLQSSPLWRGVGHQSSVERLVGVELQISASPDTAVGPSAETGRAPAV
jgi:hypothetical protein